MKNKKYSKKYNIQKFGICIFLSLALACVFPRYWANAASAPALSASTNSTGAVNGQTIDIKVNLSNNPAISTLGVALNYDSSILQYDSSVWNSAFTGSDMTLVSDDGGSVNISAVWDDAYTADGAVITVRFEAISDSSTIPVSLALRDMTDNDLAEVTNCRVTSELIMPDAGNKEETPESEANTDSNTADKQVSSANTVSSSQTPAQNTTSKSSGGTDENYKTGAGLGNDIYLLIAAFCGILALAIICRNEKNHVN